MTDPRSSIAGHQLHASRPSVTSDLLELGLHFFVRLQLVLHLERAEPGRQRPREHALDVALHHAGSVTRPR